MIISTGMDGELRYRQDNLNRATRLCQMAVVAAAVPGLSAEPFETRFISPQTIVPASRFTDSHRVVGVRRAGELEGLLLGSAESLLRFPSKGPERRIDDHQRRLQATASA
ncbi:hypothetical protein [Mesorhizobium sp. M0276]|uniref:hypothetical protein n=1 Tax=Mesorhizobium sp. M0276 TaxID=2956928 RepID=UPI0033384816